MTNIKANDGYWHFICITWDSKEGSWEIYLDGKIKRNGTGLAEKTPIPGRGRFVSYSSVILKAVLWAIKIIFVPDYRTRTRPLRRRV